MGGTQGVEQDDQSAVSANAPTNASFVSGPPADSVPRDSRPRTTSNPGGSAPDQRSRHATAKPPHPPELRNVVDPLEELAAKVRATMGKVAVPEQRRNAGSLEEKLKKLQDQNQVSKEVNMAIKGVNKASNEDAGGSQGRNVELNVIAAWNLGDGGELITMDPYVVCSIRERPQIQARTRVLQDTQNPRWNQPLVIPGYLEGETLVFDVRDADWRKPAGNNLLGSVVLRSEQFSPHGFPTDALELE